MMSVKAVEQKLRSNNFRMKGPSYLSCYLCGDVMKDPEVSGIAWMYGEDILTKAFIWEDDELFLIPAPGTITPGYLILATKRHYSRFAEITAESLTKSERIWTKVQHLGNLFHLAPYVMFEHGGVSCLQPGPACMDHAHIHMVPCKRPESVRQSLRTLFQEVEQNSIIDVISLRDQPPYIFLATSKMAFSYITPIIESQFLRKKLAIQWRVPDQWNWRIYTFPENFKKTLDMFKGRFDKNI